MKSLSLRRAGALLLALALACSLLTIPAAAISLDYSSLELQVGDTSQLTARDAVEPITWITSVPGVASVTDGLVRAVSPGLATIVAVDEGNGQTDQCTVTVKEVPVPAESVTLDTAFLQKTEGDGPVRLTAAISPLTATDKLVWTSSNPAAVSVDQRGILEFKGAGSATITAQAGSAKGFCVVIVAARPLVSSVTVTPAYVNLPIGQRASLSAVVEGGTANRSVNWKSSNPASVSVSSDGQIMATANARVGDKVTIYAQAQADPRVDGKCIVTVISEPTPKVESVIITSPSSDRYVDPGKTLALKAEAYPLTASEADRRIVWSSSNTSIARVNQTTGVVTGIAPGEAVITAQAGGDKTDTRAVETSGIILNWTEKASSGGTGEVKYLKESDVIPIFQYRDATVKWDLYGNAKGKSVTWSSSNNAVAQVLGGRVTGAYPGEATITASVDGTGFTASFKVRVSEDVADVISVSMGSSATYSFSNLISQLNSRSQAKAGAPLESVYNLTVPTKNGILYYRYNSSANPGHGVAGSERYYYQAVTQNQMPLKDVSFVPLPGFNGTAEVTYNAQATNGSSFSGTIRITASSSGGDLSYSTEMDQPISLVGEHFSDVCKGRNGQTASYVTFTQPSASQGSLQYKYNAGGQFSAKVDSSTRYYVTSNPSISDITFVPANGYSGEVKIPYRCTDTMGNTFSGTVTVTVGKGGGGSAATGRDVEYYTDVNQRKVLNGSDFNDASLRTNGYSLDRIRFDSLPSSGAGTLYLNYTSSSSTRVTTSASYYRASTPQISSISFVPATGYSGTVSIPFTATDSNRGTFSGSLIIHVGSGAGGTVHYSTPQNQAVSFNAADFNDASRRINGETLNYIRFNSLPSSSCGTLYLNYASANSTGTRAAAGTNYRRSGAPSISNITFVPANGYNGTVSIPFTAYDDSGNRFDGTVTISVGSGTGRVIFYSAAANGTVAFNGSDFNNACRSATGGTLSYVRFNTVTTGYGTLYAQYNAASRTGASASSGTNYFYSGSSNLIGSLTFAANSSAGTASIGYTGYSTSGASFNGTVEITVAGGSGGGTTLVGSMVRYTGSSAPVHFRASDFQSACAAALGTSLSYVQFNSLPGTGRLYQNYVSPSQPGSSASTAVQYGIQELGQITYVPPAGYQGTVTIPYTATDTQGSTHSSAVEIQLSNSYAASSFSDVTAAWNWARPSIEYLRQAGITTGYRDGTFRPGQSISRGEFTLMVCRAFGFPTSGSSGFPDVPAGSTYAGAIGSAQNLGIVQGDNGLFRPDRAITRQSAMTMICRALSAAGTPAPAADASVLSNYRDASQVSSFARSSVASLVQMGAVQGNSSQQLNPAAAISRAEMAVILHRVLTR